MSDAVWLFIGMLTGAGITWFGFLLGLKFSN